jgi:hypothetical protein
MKKNDAIRSIDDGFDASSSFIASLSKKIMITSY